MTQDSFYVIFDPRNIQIDGQTNFKITYGININNGTTGKIKPFEQKNKYENRNIYLKVIFLKIH